MAESIDLANDAVVYRLEGQVVDGTTGLGMDGITVDVGDAEGQSGDLVAHAKTNPLGEFTIEITAAYYKSLFLDRQPALNFRLYGDGQFPQPTVTWTPSATTAHLRISVNDLSHRPQKPAWMVVRGRVVNADGDALGGHSVTAYDQTITTAQSDAVPIVKENALGTATTDSQGRYRITYDTTKLLRQGTLHADLVVRVRTPATVGGTLVAESKPLCHAPTTAIIDLVSGNVALRGKSEYDRVRTAVLNEIGAGSIAKIVDTDIPYLACTVEQPENLVRRLVQAHVLAGQTTLPPAPLYGILRQGFPAERIAFLSLRPKPMLDALDRSIAANIVPASALTNFKTTLENKMIDFALTPRSGTDGSALGDILPIALSDVNDRKEFVRTPITHDDDTNFWATVSSMSQFTSTEVATLQRIFQWGVFTRYHIPLVTKLEALFADNTIHNVRDLARYDQDGWYAILNQAVGTTIIGAPSDIPGATSDDKVKNYAKILERTIETAFPTAVIAQRVRLELNSTNLNTFFNNNAAFDFKTTRVATYLATTPGAMTGVTDVNATTSRLKSLERVFRLTPRYAEMKPLLDAGLDSAHRIHQLGRTRFLARFSGSTISAKRFEQLYGRASWIAGAATALFGKYSGQLNNVPMLSLPNLANGSPEPVAKAADWSKLFGSPDACACEHCRSVYSPAAYLVDLLEFLDRHDTKLLTGAASPNPRYFTLRDLLIGDLHGRPNPPIPCRPDIARIELSCENTNTTLPYIDLVNEILEMVVANIADEPDHTWPSHIPIPLKPEDEDLLAAPQIIVPDAHRGAYIALRNAVHPFDMPWDFWAVEARTYLEHLGFPRHVLLETFIDTTNPQPSEIGDKLARERLRLSACGWQIITNNVASPPASSQAYWGFPGDPGWIAKLSKVPGSYSSRD